MSKIRIAVVGCGALAKYSHLKHCQMDKDIILQVVCDTDAENLAYCRKQFGAVRAESDWHKVIDADDVDLCILATHQTFRGEFIIPALKAGKPVYTEKPLAPDIDEMMEILTLLQTGKTTKRMPIIIYGSPYWKEVLNFDAMVKWGMISPEDLDLFSFCDTPEDAFACLKAALEPLCAEAPPQDQS